MVYDSIFHSENAVIRKTALLFTIPCAILPILLASSGFMSIPDKPLFFQYDFMLHGLIYIFYIYGLFLSWKAHGSYLPVLIFTLHLGSLLVYVLGDRPEWSGYATVIGIIATSIVNQYFRLGDAECAECSSILLQDNKLFTTDAGEGSKY